MSVPVLRACGQRKVKTPVRRAEGAMTLSGPDSEGSRVRASVSVREGGRRGSKLGENEKAGRREEPGEGL